MNCSNCIWQDVCEKEVVPAYCEFFTSEWMDEIDEAYASLWRAREFTEHWDEYAQEYT